MPRSPHVDADEASPPARLEKELTPKVTKNFRNKLPITWVEFSLVFVPFYIKINLLK